MNNPRYPNLDVEHAEQDADTIAEILADVRQAHYVVGDIDGSIPLTLAGDYEGEVDDELAVARSNLTTVMELLDETVAALDFVRTTVQTAKQEAEDRTMEEFEIRERRRGW